ncbi:MAG: bifunctional phosphopantothenoylcysteine decarboxylase/phosphopantothenate--cysteine ligase CoaBC [Candidatus Heimdallarchaeota archaeon]
MTTNILEGKQGVLCLTGSVAVFEGVRLARELIKHGAKVQTVLTSDACRFIGSDLLSWATERPAITKISSKAEHVSLTASVDFVIVAPATANSIAKIALGICDTPVTLVTTAALGTAIPILIVPAMHLCLFNNPFIQERISALKEKGVHFVSPEIREGKAKFPSTSSILEALYPILRKKDLAAYSFLINAGPTREFIDKVRFISNPSSGKMGMALAKAAYQRGAQITLVLGEGSTVEAPPGITTVHVTTGQEMLSNILSLTRTKKYDGFIAAAAICDFRVPSSEATKISSKEGFFIRLEPIPKITRAVREANSDLFIAVFKAEYTSNAESLIRAGQQKLREENLNLVIANDLSSSKTGFGSETNEVYVISEKDIIHIPLDTKENIAHHLLDIIKNLLSK